MYSKYLYYRIENGSTHDEETFYKGGDMGLKYAESRLNEIKEFYPNAQIRSYFLTKKLW